MAAAWGSGLMRFLCIDYMRRLAIDTARQKRIRVMVEAQKLEQTGGGPKKKESNGVVVGMIDAQCVCVGVGPVLPLGTLEQ